MQHLNMTRARMERKIKAVNVFVDGWFGSSLDMELFQEIVDKFDDGARFVEVGSWKGKSACLMALLIEYSGKQIKLDCVDHWEGSNEHHTDYDRAVDPDVAGGTLYKTFLINTSPFKKYITPVREFSVDAAKLYENESLSCVFLDASHDADSVREDIEVWLPKIKKGGILCGHDFTQYGVKEGIEQFKQASKQELDIEIREHLWIHYLEQP